MEKMESFLISFSSFFSLRSGNRKICKQRVCISKVHLPSFLPRAHCPNCWWQPRWWRILCVPLGSTLVLLLPCHSRDGFFNYSRVAWSQSLVWGGHRPTLPHLAVQPQSPRKCTYFLLTLNVAENWDVLRDPFLSSPSTTYRGPSWTTCMFL